MKKLIFNIKNLWRGEEPLISIWYYLQGMYRYRIYYSRFPFLIRRHIREQIDYRISVMDEECFNNGECKLCGCMTTALQMANKPCNKPCYPKMKSYLQWELWKMDIRLEKYRDNVG